MTSAVARPAVILEGLLVAGLLLTSAIKLRLPALPLGPGELLLIIWLALASCRCWSRRNWPGGEGQVVPFALFWLTALSATGLGAFVAQIVGIGGEEPAGRDFVALTLDAAFSLVLAGELRRSDPRRLAVRYARWAMLFFGGLLLVAVVRRRLGPFDLWYELVRFTALATNPNQIALFLAPAPFFLLEDRADRPLGSRRPPVLLAVSVIVLVGVATGSDALALSWIAGGGAVAGWLWLRAMLHVHERPTTPFLGGLLPPLIFVVSLVLWGELLYDKAEQALSSTINEGGQASDRFSLWINGVRAFSYSPVVGWGPGAHSGVNAPFSGMECHNTFVDWLTVSGTLGELALVGLLLWVLAKAVRARTVALSTGVVVLMSFSSFHYVLRQPVFWFYLVVASSWAASDRPAHDRTMSAGPESTWRSQTADGL